MFEARGKARGGEVIWRWSGARGGGVGYGDASHEYHKDLTNLTPQRASKRARGRRCGGGLEPGGKVAGIEDASHPYHKDLTKLTS